MSEKKDQASPYEQCKLYQEGKDCSCGPFNRWNQKEDVLYHVEDFTEDVKGHLLSCKVRFIFS